MTRLGRDGGRESTGSVIGTIGTAATALSVCADGTPGTIATGTPQLRAAALIAPLNGRHNAHSGTSLRSADRLIGGAPTMPDPILRAGYAEADITPPLSGSM